MRAPFGSGRYEARDVNDLELQPVRVAEEDGVVPRDVGVLLRLAFDLGTSTSDPIGELVDLCARVGLEREMVKTDGVAVVRDVRLGLAEPDRRAGAADVPDGLAPLAFYLAELVEPERA